MISFLEFVLHNRLPGDMVEVDLQGGKVTHHEEKVGHHEGKVGLQEGKVGLHEETGDVMSTSFIALSFTLSFHNFTVHMYTRGEGEGRVVNNE